MRELEALKKPVFWLILILGLVGIAIFQLPDQRLHLVFCDVGQGDATLITYQNSQILIDGGPNNQVLECLADHLPFWDRTIEMVVLTHPQADHLAGLVDVLERYSVTQIVVNSIVNDIASFWQFHQAALEEGAQIYSPQAGDKLCLGSIQFLVLWPQEKIGDSRVWQAPKHLRGSRMDSSEVKVLGTYSGNLNESSVVLGLSFGNFDALLTGDIGFDTEERIDWSGVPPAGGGIEVLKVAHHGSKYSTSEEFLEEISPDVAVIFVGKNSFGHPTQEVLERLGSIGAKILRTDQQGEIEIVSDGKTWEIGK